MAPNPSQKGFSTTAAVTRLSRQTRRVRRFRSDANNGRGVLCGLSYGCDKDKRNRNSKRDGQTDKNFVNALHETPPFSWNQRERTRTFTEFIQNPKNVLQFDVTHYQDGRIA